MGVYSRLNRPIVVVDYDPHWPVLFEQEAAKILTVLGNKVLTIEHGIKRCPPMSSSIHPPASASSTASAIL